MKLSNWGNYPSVDAEMTGFSSVEEAIQKTADWKEWIPRGMGRCYGDSSLAPKILSTLQFNRFISFDENTGLLRCQSGVTLEDILNVFLSRGWFPPVVPGTKFITIGGAIASDIHGKNHHSEGSFSRHVISFNLLIPSGEIVNCSLQENQDLFRATCGGMGLTGLILDAEFSLKKVETAYISQVVSRAANLEDVMKQFQGSMDWTYSVAWIDCLKKGSSMGRSVLLKGEHATLNQLNKSWQKENPLSIPAKRKLNVPFFFPGFVLNGLSMRIFNFFLYHKESRHPKASIVTYDKFFYPLDGILNWNRIYGKRGFTQYQFVLPPETSAAGLKKMLERISSHGSGSFLAVLKWFGKQEGMISFPREGYTLALDFPVRTDLFPLLNELDKMVMDLGGRIYLTKDARMGKEIFEGTYPHLQEFEQIKRKIDPDRKLNSLQWQRVDGNSQSQSGK